MEKDLYKQSQKNLPNFDSLDMKPYLPDVRRTHQQIILELKENKIPPLNIAFENNDLEEIKNLAETINKKFEKVAVLGVGGSSLGGKTLVSIIKNSSRKIIFMESIDSCSIEHNLQEINLEKTLFLVISKSGQTIETTCQTLIIIDKFRQQKIQNFHQNFIFITQDLENTIAKIATEIGSKIYFHPQNIGGRFSYLSIVGLLPAAICGLDIFAIRNGARKILNDFLHKEEAQNDVMSTAASQLYLFDQGFHNNVIMPYIDSLKDYTDWYRQLWAESLGKNGFGSTPITSMGTVDQHSQLQLYLDGPRDKFFTFIVNKNPQNNLPIIDFPNCPTLFGGKNLNEIVKVEQESTIEILVRKNLPIRVFELENLDEEKLSGLMMQMFLETIIIAKIKNINPFDQPAVELRKDLAKQYLQN
jgi:glucose-6-phosphate isomerase